MNMTILSAFLAATSMLPVDGPVKHRGGVSFLPRDWKENRKSRRKMAKTARRKNRR